MMSQKARVSAEDAKSEQFLYHSNYTKKNIHKANQESKQHP